MAKRTLIYEIYTPVWRSFGEIERFLPALVDLLVDYVWLTPCYPHGGVDGGYDITDYCAVDSRLGTMKDFDHLVETAKRLGIKVMMDLVPNHTSDQHPWFQRSAARDPYYEDFYHWTDWDLGWGTMFDGTSASKWCEQRGQYYLHIYHEAQPDLNWNNGKVAAMFGKIIDFWTYEHGVQGFRVDSAQLIGKNLRHAILPRSLCGTAAGMVNYYAKPQTIQILQRMFAHRHLFTVGELGVPDHGTFRKFVAPQGPLTAAFNAMATNAIDKRFGFLDAKTDPERAEKALDSWSKVPGFAAALESHDLPRYTSRSGASGRSIIFDLFHSGANVICLYQGQELGLKNPMLGMDIENYKDIQTITRYNKAVESGQSIAKVMNKLSQESRDNARVPLPMDIYKEQYSRVSSIFSYTREQIIEWKKQ